MAKNSFDQFDAPGEANPFDQFDPPPAAKGGKPGMGAAGDLVSSVKSGVEQMPGQLTGLADIPFALAFNARPVSAVADAAGKLTGFQPGKWAKEVPHSADYQQSQQDVGEAWAPVEAVSADKSASNADYLMALAKASPNIVSKYLTNPLYSINQVSESLPSMLAGGMISRPLMVAGRLLPVAENTAAGIAARAGTAGYLERAVGEKLASPIAGGIGEGAVQSGQAMDQSTGPDQRKNAVAALASGFVDALVAVGAGRAANKMGWETHNTAMAKFGDMAPDQRIAVLKRVAGGAASESLLQELPQSMQEQMFQNWADGKPLMEGVVRQGVEGGISGGLMGAGFNAMPSRDGQSGGQPVTVDTAPAQETGGPEAAAPPAGAAPTTPPAGTAPVSAAPDEAERALRAPGGDTGLDRVNAIEAERAGLNERLGELNRPGAGYSEMFDQERADLTSKIAELDQERGQITKTWPAAVPGGATSFSTEAGARIDAQYALMSANDLVTSHDEGLRANPNYPAEMQPRERDRAASEMQVSSIVQKLDPARLGISADAANGAPIVGADGLVESGNARTIALKRVYRASGQKAEDYKSFLRASAAQFGITPESVDTIEKPVLVRVRATPVNRAEFARQANASTVAAMSPSEQARSDAQRIDSMEDLTPDDSGDFSNAASRPFVQRFLARLPVTEQAGLVDAAGRLSTAGYARVRNAVLAKAYGDSPTLQRMVESMDDNLRNVSKALITAAPRVAQIRQAVAQGDRFDADITPDLLAALEELSALKESGTSLKDALAQGDMLGDTRSPEAKQLLQFLADNIRRPKRMADFIVAYTQALDEAGDPKQGSLLGETAPPSKSDLMGKAQGSINATAETSAVDAGGGQPGQDQAAAGKAGRKPAAAPRGGGGNQGNGAAAANDGAVANDWAVFPASSGALGIPRADMPQIKAKHRGALVNFLEGRGITDHPEVVDGKTLKPTQDGYSRAKVDKYSTWPEGRDRSVLVSSDNFVLDGHHQWIAKTEAGEPVKVIRFDAPIGDLLKAVAEFPSVVLSDGASKRAEAVLDFRDALADLAQIASKHTRAAMMPEDTPGLMKTLVKLFEAAIEIVGTDLKAAIAHVKAAMKADPKLKPSWNKIGSDQYRQAAAQALQNIEAAGNTDLATAPKAAMINGRAYDMKRDNFVAPQPPDFMDPALVEQAKGYIAKFLKELAPVEIDAADRARAEDLLKPMISAADKVKVEFDQAVIDIAADVGAVGQMLAPLKGIKRGAEKLVDEGFQTGKMRDILRSTIVVSSYDDAQAVVDAIRAKFAVVPGRIKNRTAAAITGPDVSNEGFLASGYGDVLVNVEIGGVQAEIQINVPEMMSAKGAEGHKLYEIERQQPEGSDVRAMVVAAQLGYYSAASAAAAARNAASEIERGSDKGGQILHGTNAPSIKLNAPSPGMNTAKEPLSRSTNLQPSGNLSGTFIATSPKSSVSQKPGIGYSEPDLFGASNANDQHRRGSAQGQGTGTVPRPARQGRTEPVRRRPGGPDLFGDGAPHAEGSREGQLGPIGDDRLRSQNENGRSAQQGSGDGRPAGVPAGRDIPTKSGRNYEFGPDDLTYAGSWAKKAEQNVEAVALLKKLEAEGLQATREEQSVLAKFVGWGASDLANNLFGSKLDKQAAAIGEYETAASYFDKRGNRPMVRDPYAGYRGTSEGFYQAFAVLKSKDDTLDYSRTREITRAQLDAARPPADVRRWLAMRDRLRELMTADELAEASRSTQYAHFTSKAIVQSMWRAMTRMGFAGGRVLEPGAGIGVFPGLMPTAMANNTAYTGIEFDATTGGILKQLFPDESILVESFVDTKLPKGFYDVAVGNPPFSGTKILGDPEYAKLAMSLHDYFFAKTIDRVKPGGIVAFVTSRYTMDKLDDKARAYLAERADLVGAIRMPQTAFKKNAGTDVVTDVLFLRKKVPGEAFEFGQAWAKSAPMKVGASTFPVNEYFHAHPEMVLGSHSDTGEMQNSVEPQYTVLPSEGDIEAQFDAAVQNLPANVYVVGRGSAGESAKIREIDFNPKAKKEGNYYVNDAGVLMAREGGFGVRVEGKKPKDVALIKAFIPLRDALKQAHYDQLNDGDWEDSLKALQKAYAAFTKEHGQVNQFTTRTRNVKVTDEETGEVFTDEEEYRTPTLLKALEDDPDWTLVAALENVNDDTGAITPGQFLTKRVLGKPERAEVATPVDALLTTLNDLGKVDIPAIAKAIGLSEADTIESLGSAVYDDPENEWVTADEYLSGNVKRKLEIARQAAKSDPSLERNVKALEGVQPSPKSPSQINAALGMNWIPGDVYQDFLKETAGVTATVEWNVRAKKWAVSEKSGGSTLAATADWGTGRRNTTALLEHALTGRKVHITTPPGRNEPAVFDATATAAANDKLDALKTQFQAWLWRDAARADKLVQIYNDRFNTTVPRSFDGSHLTLPGTSKTFNVFDHVKRGAWRIVQSGNTYLAHAVGSGKTFQMVISAMEQKRLGLIKKPMMVVPNHMLQQFASEWLQLYPAARLMVADEANFHKDKRRRFVSRVALSDLDGVIITQSAFKILDLDPAFKKKMIEQQLVYMRAALIEAGGDPDRMGKSREPKIKQIEKQIENMEQKLLAATSGEGKDKNANFDELGVDMLYVDEAHNYRKLDFTTNRQVKGLSPEGSAMAFDLYMKSRYLEERTPGRSLVMASGTPVTNTVAELYTVQKFLGNQALVDRGIEDFDSWAAMFGRERTTLEPNAAGKYEPVTRFSDFVNVPELTQMFREFADVLNADYLADLLGDKRPKVNGGSRTIVQTPKGDDYKLYQKVLEKRVKDSKAWRPSKYEPNNPDPIIRIIGDGRLAAIDMRFVWPDRPSDPDSKLNRMADDVIREFKRTADVEYKGKDGQVEPNKGSAMMVFSDLGFGAGVAGSRGFNARAWFEKRMRDGGVPMSQVAFMSDYKKSSAKLKLFKDVNAGRIRVLVGSSKNMGTGVNAQQRLKALFHLDSPWFPADIEQREGRIVRQGNKNPLVDIYAYVAKGTYDENMWKMLATKQRFIDLALSGDPNIREIEDLSGQSLFELAAAIAAEDPRVMQLAGARSEVEKLERLYYAHEDQRATFRQQYQMAQMTLAFNEQRLPEAVERASMVQDLSGDKFVAKVGGKSFTERADWGKALVDRYKDLVARVETQSVRVGQISGFDVTFHGELKGKEGKEYFARLDLDVPNRMPLVWEASANPVGVAMRAQNEVVKVARLPAEMRDRAREARATMDALSTRLETPFPMAQMLSDKIREVQELERAIAAGDADTVTETPWGDMAIDTGAGNDADVVLSRGAGAGMDVAPLRALADRLKRRMPNMPKVHVLADPSGAPAALQDYIRKQGAWNDVDGAMHGGELYLFASGLPDLARAEHVLAEHEAGHMGLHAILGDALKPTMAVIYANNAAIRRAVTALQARGDLSVTEATEEAIVDIPTSQLVKLKGWRKVTVAVRNALADAGFTGLADKLGAWLDSGLTDQERADLFVAGLVRAARRYVAGKGPGVASRAAGATRLAAGVLSEDIAKQERWLQAEARSRGYTDIEDLLAKNYPLFEKLAALWREKNPADTLLSRSGAAQTDTPAFKRWFGASKVVDEQGRPLAVYHGTANEFTTFEPAEYGTQKGGFWFTFDKVVADGFAQWGSESIGGDPVTMEVYLSIKNPKIIEASEMMAGGEHSFDAEYKAVNGARREGYDGLLVRNVPDRDRVADQWVAFHPEQIKSAIGNNGQFDPSNPDIRLSRAAAPPAAGTAAQRAEAIIQTKVGSFAPLDAVAKTITRLTGVERLMGAAYRRAGFLLDRYTSEKVKAGFVSDYGVPEAVIDQRAMMQGRQRVQLRQAGSLIEKLSTLTRAESRVAHAWMNEQDPKAADDLIKQLPEQSVKVLEDVRQMIDRLSRDAVRLGQLSHDAYERNRFAYLRRSYAKHVVDQVAGDGAKRARVISILGDQYKGRGLVEAASMQQVKNIAPEWWKRKLQAGKADASLKGEKFLRLERHAPTGAGTAPMEGIGDRPQGKLLEVNYYPASEPLPAKYADWDQAGTFEVRDIKGDKVVLWRDFTKTEREKMGEIDEARFAIAKTLHGMIHDVEVGRYLEWLAHTYALKDGQAIPGEVVDASERFRDTFKPSEWVKVPDTKISGTDVPKYGKLAGRYLPGPVWNDLRQTVNGQFKPLGDTYAKVLGLWKTVKTALAPTVHMNNVMANFVMADWHDVGAAHTAKALRIVLAAMKRDGKGLIGRTGNLLSRGGMADREAATEILNRYKDSGGDIGGWATNEIATEQLDPLLKALEGELAASGGNSMQAQVGVMSALQHALMLRFPSAWDAFKGSKPGQVVGEEAKNMIGLYQAEDDIFRLAAWLKYKEDGMTDQAAGKIARRSFLDYRINAPWIQAMRNSGWPFISFTYRAVPRLLEIAGTKPHKLMKLMALAGALNALGLAMAGGGGDDDKERQLLPEEKAGRIWGLVPKMIRMPWNDANGSPVYLDIRRFIPVGDVLDVGQGHSAVPILPGLVPGGPLVIAGELLLNRSAFTGKEITLDTDTAAQQAAKVADHLYKAFAPNILGLPGTYATQGVVDAVHGKTDKFGREQSVAQAVASSMGVKLGSYPADVLRRNLQGKAAAETMEIDRNITALKRQVQIHKITPDELREAVQVEQEKKAKVYRELAEKLR